MGRNIKKVLSNVYYTLRGCLFRIIMLFLRFTNVKNNRVLVVSFYGKGFGDNSKYIVNELLKQSTEYEIYWALKDTKNNLPKGVSGIKYNSLKYFYILSTAKIWIDNARIPYYILKKKNQVYFQVWHGCLALKKIEYDAVDTLPKSYFRYAENDNKLLDYMISNSHYCSEVIYRGAFQSTKTILEFGCPREDILFNKSEKIISKIKAFFNIDKETKIILYAPTFRDNYNNQYDINFEKIIKFLEKKYSCKWKVLFRLHPNVSNKSKKYGINYNEQFINASFYSDIQEIIIASDLIITDYSSLMFDGMIANIPVILYANDIQNYMKERGFYFDFSELPFSICQTNDELFNILSKKDLDTLIKKYSFFKKSIGLNKGGKASKKVADFIEAIINKCEDDYEIEKYKYKG